MASEFRPRHVHFAVVIVGLLALFFRLWGIGFALPYDFTADEPHHIVQALKIGAGEGGPLLRIWHTVGKGGLDYLLFFEYGLLYVFWRITGEVRGPDDFAVRYLEDPTAFYLLGRLTIAILGTLTCLIIFWVGRRMFDARVGLGAAFIGATAYFHGAQSHFINVHVAMAFGLWAGLGCYLEYERSARVRWAAASGFLIGAATALAYTAAIGLGLVLLALISTAYKRSSRPKLVRATLALGLSFGAAIALMSPDLILGIGKLLSNFGVLSGGGPAAESGGLRESIDAVTILRTHDWMAYVDILAKPVNVSLSVGALLGILIGVFRGDRWVRVLAVGVAVFVLIVSAADRSPAERYLLPITPALWLVCSYGVRTVSRDKLVWNLAGLAAVVALPLWNLIGQDYIWTLPDTRVVAKSWIETTVPPNTKILMDGMRFRFVQSPPLNPNDVALARRLAGAEASELTISERMLALYIEAQKSVAGPKYDLYSTVYGLEVDELDHYVDACFDYIVTSSLNENRYSSEAGRARFPKSARFYGNIKTDARFEQVYRVGPVPWQRGGPTITVYRVASTCHATR
jgi:4-amino-4-deoxy-L-arabinose transferase-like glycosyltransferase